MLNNRKFIASLTLLALPAVVMLGAAHTASADPKGGAPPPKSCVVENQDAQGNTVSTSTVAVGTQVGLFHCGSDGDWHFGTVTTDRVTPPESGHAPIGPTRR